MAEPSISHKKHEWGTTGDSPFNGTKRKIDEAIMAEPSATAMCFDERLS